jgi:hypothetical protein
VEGREHEPALGQVRALVEEDDRVAPDERLEDSRALARMQHVGRRREDLLDLLGVGEHHERRRPEQAQREAPPVAGAAVLEEGDRARPPAQRLRRRRGARAGRKGCRAHGLRL